MGDPPGRPGLAPTWSSSAKDAVGTSQGPSRVWFTVGRGILNEVYWPHVDRPQIRDLGFIVADGAGFWSEVKRDAEQALRYERPGVPALWITHRHPAYELALRICTDVHSDVVRIEARLRDLRGRVAAATASPRSGASAELPRRPLRLYPLLAPHLGFSGLHNRAWCGAYKGRPMLFAQHDDWVLAFGAEPSALRQSVGYVGSSDGWQDFAANGAMTWTHSATDTGNVAGMVELAMPPDGAPVHLALGFGARPEEAGLVVNAALATNFDDSWAEYVAGWIAFLDTCSEPPSEIDLALRDEFRISGATLRCHQDRTEPGALVASLSIPWGSARNDLGGYHLVWSRDLVESAGAVVAFGAEIEARRSLAYLQATQETDGHWPQNQWVDGVPYWSGIQLDEAAYPMLLVAALRLAGGAHMHGHRGEMAERFEHLLADFALDRLALAAAGFLARTGPATQQDRWEENAGLTPSTLAPVVAGLVAASRLLPAGSAAAAYCLELADDWNASIEAWTYATGTPLAAKYGVDGHYVRIADRGVLSGGPISTPIPIRNQVGGSRDVPATDVVGTDFLALVRFGLRSADDPRIRSTIAVADGELKVITPNGPSWHRYGFDGYGETADGGPFDGAGIGRAWPLLTGERGHYALVAGEDPRPYLEAMLAMSSAGGMIPEQVWDSADIPERGLFLGRPSGSAMPLAWAHAEFIKLARSIQLGHPIDRPPAAWERYEGRAPAAVRATWRFDAQRPSMTAGLTLRLETLAPAIVRYSCDGWRSVHDIGLRDTGLGVWIADVPGSSGLEPGEGVDFTFLWPEAASGAGRWEGRNFRVGVG